MIISPTVIASLSLSLAELVFLTLPESLPLPLSFAGLDMTTLTESALAGLVIISLTETVPLSLSLAGLVFLSSSVSGERNTTINVEEYRYYRLLHVRSPTHSVVSN